MRKIFLIGCNTRTEAKRLAPWAARYARACGGYHAFESVSDYNVWRAQQ